MKNSVWAVLAAFLWMASPAGGDPGDERILLAKDAARSGDRNRLALYAPPTGHPLDPYPEYWALSAHVARPGDINPLPILDFLERQRGSLLAERLRGEWLRALGKRGEWDTLAAEFPAMEQPEQDVKCYHLQARLGLGDAAALDRLLREEMASPGMAPLLTELLDRRNAEMAGQIAARLQRGERPFVAVGAGHLGGATGLLALLARRGYRPVQVMETDE